MGNDNAPVKGLNLADDLLGYVATPTRALNPHVRNSVGVFDFLVAQRCHSRWHSSFGEESIQQHGK